MPDITICESLAAITAPILVLVGDSDPLVPPQQADVMSQAIAGAELIVLTGAGHLLYAERPSQYQQALRDWLAKTDINESN